MSADARVVEWAERAAPLMVAWADQRGRDPDVVVAPHEVAALLDRQGHELHTLCLFGYPVTAPVVPLAGPGVCDLSHLPVADPWDAWFGMVLHAITNYREVRMVGPELLVVDTQTGRGLLDAGMTSVWGLPYVIRVDGHSTAVLALSHDVLDVRNLRVPYVGHTPPVTERGRPGSQAPAPSRTPKRNRAFLGVLARSIRRRV